MFLHMATGRITQSRGVFPQAAGRLRVRHLASSSPALRESGPRFLRKGSHHDCASSFFARASARSPPLAPRSLRRGEAMSSLRAMIGPGDHVDGRTDAAATLVEYGDY